MLKVVKLVYGNDGKARSAILKMPNKPEAHYSIKHLYLLEIEQTHHLQTAEGTKNPT